MSKTNNKIAVLALGAFEQHGEHLPLETDTIIAQEIIVKLKELLYKNIQLEFLPTQTIGYSPEHLFNKLSKSLNYIDAVENIVNLAQQAKQKNIKKLVIINTHGGNSPIIAIAAMEIRVRLNMFCASTNWLRFPIDKNIIAEEDRVFDIHGGFIETSTMLFLKPELVELKKCKNFSNNEKNFRSNYKYLSAYGRHPFAWLMPDLNQEGACGNAAKANANSGKEIFNNACLALARFIKEVEDFDLQQLYHIS